ncbi:hypothetical protein EJ06DRAFT_510749 [Trichodelitschia bisporula]|uniref:Uncharacterized protein n=1 Tax=Trichodelitschia bisporula TaxID=703511 RepID=A0A6G1HWZ5_9PEZI|nr:hypothetical protein EJ06DRAFT_510749 [Trichodelitschia bisporula]
MSILTEPVVRRPGLASKPKRPSSLRLSFGPGEAPTEQSDGDAPGLAATPKKSRLGGVAAAERRLPRSSLSSELLPFRAGQADDRPSYSKDYINELKQSTPSTPKDLTVHNPSADGTSGSALDMVSKFGPLVSVNDTPAIPTDAEIKEKKERRARLAKEKEFISLHGSDDEDDNRVLPWEKPKYAETRLVPDDEDVAEGFDEFVEDGKIALGRKTERELKRRRRAEMAEMIAEAEGSGSDQETDDSEYERKAAYDAAQTRAGTYGHHNRELDGQRPRTPPKITPLPEMSDAVGRLRKSLAAMEETKAAKLKKLELLRREKKEIADMEIRVQSELKDTGERFEKLRIEAGLTGANGAEVQPCDSPMVDRGLESLGTMPLHMASEDSDD